ncbi:MAG: hypothetical protein ACOC3X_00800 [Nanoarchaeota archaeon]
MIKNKAQISLEYVTIIAFVFFISSTFLYIFGDRIVFSNKDNVITTADNIANMFEIQVEIANRAYNGYESVFKMPIRTSLYEYNFSIFDNNTLLITINEYDHVIGLRNNTISHLSLDDSLGYYPIVIRKNHGLIEISSCISCTESLKNCFNDDTLDGCSGYELND